MIQDYLGVLPRLGRDAFVAPTALLIGRVVVGDRASVWYGAVLRGDLDWVRIGAGSNIQDGCVLHTVDARVIRETSGEERERTRQMAQGYCRLALDYLGRAPGRP